MNRNPLSWRRVAASSAWVLVAVVALAAPRVLDTFWTSLLIQILVFGLFALSADLLIGHVGLLPMGHAAFFAVGAYATAILEVRHGQGFVLSVLGGLVAATLLAVVFGLAVRTGDVYFILLTLALGNVVWGAAMRWTSFTGGENGVSNVPAPVIAGFRFQRLDDYYYLVLANWKLGIVLEKTYAAGVRTGKVDPKITETFGSMIHCAEQSIPKASTVASRSPSRTSVTARITGTSADTPGTLRAVSRTAGSMPPSVASPTIRNGVGPAIR